MTRVLLLVFFLGLAGSPADASALDFDAAESQACVGDACLACMIQSIEMYAPSGQASAAGEQVTLWIGAYHLEGRALQWQASGLPPGLEIDGESGVIFGSLDEASLSAATYTVRVFAFTDQSEVNSVEFEWTVLPIPSPLSPAEVSVIEI